MCQLTPLDAYSVSGILGAGPGKLHPVGPGLVAREAVDPQRMIAVHPIDGREDIVLDAMLLKQASPRITLSKVGLPPLSMW